MIEQAKQRFWTLSKALGLFQLARFLTRRRLRILCYHGFTMGDEDGFRPRYFMSQETFDRRLSLLKTRNFPVLPLDEAMKRLARGDLPPCAVAITIDDGLASVYLRGIPVLKKYGYPSMLYLTTYYFVKDAPIYMLVVAYLFWKTSRERVQLRGFGIPELDSAGEIYLTSAERERLSEIFSEYGNGLDSNERRTAILRTLAERLDVDLDAIIDSRVFNPVTSDEVVDMAANGMAIELHTHRHRFPLDPVAASREIEDNRAVIDPLVGGPRRHFCYPSGDWDLDHWPILTAAGVEFATTCEPGLVGAETPKLAINRILDNEEITVIEFEAEMCGYKQLVRRARRLFGGARQTQMRGEY